LMTRLIEAACEGLGNHIDAGPIMTETIKNLMRSLPQKITCPELDGQPQRLFR